MAFAYSLILSAKQLATLLNGLEMNFGQAILEMNFGQAILEDVDRIRFVGIARPPDNFHFDSAFDPQQWERGRAFGEQMELRWRRRRNEFAALIIAESSVTLPANVQQEINELPKPDELAPANDEIPLQAILWGEWQDPNAEADLPDPKLQWWYEERIPKFLGYPWPARDKRLAVKIARYHDRAPARPDEEKFPGDFIYRFVQLVPAKEEAAPQEQKTTEVERQ